MNLAIITGASAGIGAEYSKQIKERYQPKHIWLIARRKERLSQLAKELESSTTKVNIFPLDLSKHDSYKIIEEALKKQNLNISLLVNNAGVGKFGFIQEISIEDHEQMIALNITALVALSKICLPYLDKNASIIQVASIAGLISFPRFATYSATKTFVIYWSKALQEELSMSGKKDITVQTVCPGPVESEFFDLASQYQKRIHKSFAPTSYVVGKSLRQLDNKKTLSIYGLSMNIFYWIYPLLPERLINFILRITNRTN